VRPLAPIALLLALTPHFAAAQPSLSDRIRAAGTRTVAFSAPSRAEVCGDGSTTYSDGLNGPRARFHEGRFYSSGPWESRFIPCDRGPVRVTVRVVDGVPSWLRTAAGPLPVLGDSVQDFGAVSTADASEFLRTLARTGEGRASVEALQPLVMLDSTPRWEILAAAARDTSRLLRYRRRASDILARAAAGTLGTDDSADDDPTGARREAVYAIARRREKSEDPVPQLMEISRTNSHRDVRKAALYQLGQTADPRVVELFMAMLRVPRRSE
jgi:hypothetical protein